MDLSIIIVNWRSAEYLAGCLVSIYAVPLRCSFEIVVIDNASFDGCDRMLAERFPAVLFLQSTTNMGFAGANNFAFSRSTGTTVCFLNPDTVVRGTALQTLYDALYTVPDAGAVGALLYNDDGSVQTSCVLPFPTILNQAFDIDWLRRRIPRARLFGAAAIFSAEKKPQVVEAVSGACIMMDRAMFMKTGMFSTDYFMYSEDIDLCNKVALAGKKVYLINTAAIIHFGGGSSKEQKNRLFGALMTRESNYRMLRKFRGRAYALLYRMTVGVSALVRCAGLLLFLIPTVVTGRKCFTVEILQRWWHLLAWSAGTGKMVHSFGTESPDI